MVNSSRIVALKSEYCIAQEPPRGAGASIKLCSSVVGRMCTTDGKIRDAARGTTCMENNESLNLFLLRLLCLIQSVIIINFIGEDESGTGNSFNHMLDASFRYFVV